MPFLVHIDRIQVSVRIMVESFPPDTISELDQYLYLLYNCVCVDVYVS